MKDYNSYTKMVMDYRQRILLASLRRDQGRTPNSRKVVEGPAVPI
jgi:hypothetical protein